MQQTQTQVQTHNRKFYNYVLKNENNEADVSVAFGTLVPFFSTGALQRKNFYKEAGLASFGDYVVLNPGYFGLIKIANIRGL